jgi:hypothetical protein
MPIPHAAAILTQNQEPYRQRNRGFRYTGFFSIDGGIAAPANQAYYLSLFLPSAIAIDWIAYILTSGTCTLAVQQGATIAGLANVTSLTALAATNAFAITDCTATDSTNDCAIGNVVALVVSAGAAPVNLAFSLGYHRR